MNIQKNLEQIERFVEYATTNPKLELEMRIKDSINDKTSKETFKRVLKRIKGIPNIEQLRPQDTLEITYEYEPSKTSSIRVIIKNQGAIKKYCNTNKLEEINEKSLIFQKKRLIYIDSSGNIVTFSGHNRENKRVFPIDINNYKFRFNLKMEENMSNKSVEVSKIYNNWINKQKSFRYKKRFSFITSDKLFRFDLTILKTSNRIEEFGPNKKVLKSNILDYQQKFVIMPTNVIGKKFDDWWNELDDDELVEMKGKKYEKYIMSKTLQDSKTLVSEPTYEIELEYLGNKKGYKKGDPLEKAVIVSSMIQNIGIILQAIQKSYYLTSEEDKKLVRTQLKTLLGYPKFSGPMNVTLELKNIVKHSYEDYKNDINSIRNGYTVTDKADGERNLLVILSDGRLFMVNRKNDIKYLGAKLPDYHNTIIDGEYINQNKEGDNVSIYMIFDIYFNGNPKEVKPAYNHIWYSEDNRIMTRSKILDTFKNVLGESSIINKKDSIEIGYKKYQYGAMNKDDDDSLIFQKCKDMYNPDVYRYKIDGLILMPIYTKVKGDKSGKDVVNIGGTWDYNFKWKPPEENTIDFKVSFEKEGKLNKDKVFPIITEVENGDKILHRYKKANLIVGYDQKQDETLDYCMILLLNERKKYVKEKIFDPPDNNILVNKTNLLLDNNKIICEDGSEMKDGDIVEMRYNPNGENDMIWEPLRVRYDKTNAQFFTIANNVWETISTPITENVIKGLEEDVYDKKEDPNDLYYVGNSDSESKALRDYHNYIKSNLIRGVCNSLNKNIQVMDTSIGRGGDIKKYIDEDCRITYLLGLYLWIPESSKGR